MINQNWEKILQSQITKIQQQQKKNKSKYNCKMYLTNINILKPQKYQLAVIKGSNKAFNTRKAKKKKRSNSFTCLFKIMAKI